jgi:DNA processing protein
MDSTNDALFPWVVLDCAEVSGRMRGQVLERGVQQVLEDGWLRDEKGAYIEYDFAAARREVEELLRWPWQGGRVLGGPSAESLGAWLKAPLMAYARGNVALADAQPAVAIVGTRKPSPRGIEIAKRLARDVVEAGGTVVSGGAYGIDRAAHEAALEAGGKTIAVLGQPIGQDLDERRRIGKLLDEHPDRALSVTAYGPWIKKGYWLWAKRNAHIAGLAQSVVIVEGREDSGTKYTAEGARAHKLPCWAVVGDTEMSALPNWLVDKGWAKPLNLLRAVEQMLPGTVARPRSQPAESDPLLCAIAERGGRALVDQVAGALGIPARQVLVKAAHLEIGGRLRREGSWLAIVAVPR